MGHTHCLSPSWSMTSPTNIQCRAVVCIWLSPVLLFSTLIPLVQQLKKLTASTLTLFFHPVCTQFPWRTFVNLSNSAVSKTHFFSISLNGSHSEIQLLFACFFFKHEYSVNILDVTVTFGLSWKLHNFTYTGHFAPEMFQKLLYPFLIITVLYEILSVLALTVVIVACLASPLQHGILMCIFKRWQLVLKFLLDSYFLYRWKWCLLLFFSVPSPWLLLTGTCELVIPL